MKKFRTWKSFIALSLALAGCASTESNPNDPRRIDSTNPLLSEGPYNLKVPHNHAEVIQNNSAGDAQFTGLYNSFELKATVLNSAVRESLIRRQSEYYMWDSAQLSTEREKALQELNSQTEVFLSFATPDRKNDNLADTKKAIWRIFLDVGGRRYVGQVKKDRRLIAELSAQFPYHTRWNTAYTLTFPVSTTSIETQNIKLTLTGPLGTRALEFRPNGQGPVPVQPPPTLNSEPEAS